MSVPAAGWGSCLDQGLAWKRVAQLVREAYEKVAPAALAPAIGKTPMLQATRTETVRERNRPHEIAARVAVLEVLRKICLRLPESREGRQFGYPVWQAGKKTFVLGAS